MDVRSFLNRKPAATKAKGDPTLTRHVPVILGNVATMDGGVTFGQLTLSFGVYVTETVLASVKARADRVRKADPDDPAGIVPWEPTGEVAPGAKGLLHLFIDFPKAGARGREKVHPDGFDPARVAVLFANPEAVAAGLETINGMIDTDGMPTQAALDRLEAILSAPETAEGEAETAEG